MDNTNYLHRVIYVADSPEQAINYKYSKDSKHLTDDIIVLDRDEIKEHYNGVRGLSLPYDINSGDILLRRPDKQGYIVLNENSDSVFYQSKAQDILTIARALGATKIKYINTYVSEFQRNFSNTTGLSVLKKVKVDTTVQTSKEQKCKRYFSIEDEIEVSTFTENDYERAALIAQYKGLYDDETVRGLLDARNPRFGQLVKSRKIVVNMSSELNKSLDIAIRLNAVSLFKLDNNTVVQTKERFETNVELEIFF